MRLLEQGSVRTGGVLAVYAEVREFSAAMRVFQASAKVGVGGKWYPV